MAAAYVARLEELSPQVTKDGSTVRELAGPSSPAGNQSLAEATVAPGAETVEHFHRRSEELYLFTSGAGRMRLGEAELEVATGDCVLIAPGTHHKLWNTGSDPLVLLCCSAPPYSHEDTVLVD
jgi:mannose-6-phosphate isomerase-like protein (cupin superfamily)